MTRLSEIDDATDDEPICDCPHGSDRCGNRRHRSNSVCTRPDGHDGPHVACGGNSHQLTVWDDDGNALDGVSAVETDYGTGGPGGGA